MTIETFDQGGDFQDIESMSIPYAVSSLGRAAYTLFVTPEHEKLHQLVESENGINGSQPLQPPIEQVALALKSDVLPNARQVLPPKVDTKRLIFLGGTLIQFSDYVPKFHTSMKVPYEKMEELHGKVIAKSQESGPLDYSDQLATALEITDGDVSRALWRLFITSRHYARWLDGKIVQGMPDLSKGEKVGQMLKWRKAIAACKDPENGLAQDPNGDTYYTWTHAFAKYMYSLAPEHETRTSRAAVRLFHNGTSVMHKVVHTLNKQGVQSNHSIAATYGNRIGQVCVDYARIKGADTIV